MSKDFTYRKVASSRPVYYSILQLFDQRSQYISIKFPLHKPSENVLLTETVYCLRLYGTSFIYIKFSSILSDSSDSLKASWFDCFFLEQQIFFINIPRQNKQLRPIARAKVTEINPADTNRIKIIVNPGFASSTFWQSKSFSVQVDPNGWILHEQVTDPLNPHTFLFSVVLSAKAFICRKIN